MGRYILPDDVLDIPSNTWFLIILIALSVAICYSFTWLAFRHQMVLRLEQLDRWRSHQRGREAADVWYLEEELRYDLEKKKKRAIAARQT